MTLDYHSRWVIYSDERLYRTLEHTKELYGADIKYTFIASNRPGLEEEEIIYSRAAARFQHLMILKE